MTQGYPVQGGALEQVTLKKDNILEAARVDTTDLGSSSEEPEEISVANLQVLLVEKEELLVEKDEQLANMRALVSRLEARLLSLEERLREKERERFVRVGKNVEELREQLAEELRKRQAAQYELIEKTQRLLELEPKLAEGEQTIMELQQQIETMQDLRTATTVPAEDTPRSCRLLPKGGSTPRVSAPQVPGGSTPSSSNRLTAPVVAVDLSRTSLGQRTPVQAPASAVAAAAAETSTAERGAQVRRTNAVATRTPVGSFVAPSPAAAAGVPSTPRAPPSTSVVNAMCQDAGPWFRAASPMAVNRGWSPSPWAAQAMPQLAHAGPCSVAWSNGARTPRMVARLA